MGCQNGSEPSNQITLDYMLVSTTASIIMWPTIDSTLIFCKRLKPETVCLEQYIYDPCN